MWKEYCFLSQRLSHPQRGGKQSTKGQLSVAELGISCVFDRFARWHAAPYLLHVLVVFLVCQTPKSSCRQNAEIGNWRSEREIRFLSRLLEHFYRQRKRETANAKQTLRRQVCDGVTGSSSSSNKMSIR